MINYPAYHFYLRFVLLGLLLVIVSACIMPGWPAAPTARPVPTEIAPDFQLTASNGQTVTLHALRGRWVIINFWATWCIPCRDEMLYLQQLAEQASERLTVLGVNMREAPTDAQAFVDAAHVHFPILLHPDDATLLAYNVRGLPLTVVVSPDGHIAFRQFGPLQPKTFEPWLRQALAGR